MKSLAVGLCALLLLLFISNTVMENKMDEFKRLSESYPETTIEQDVIVSEYIKKDLEVLPTGLYQATIEGKDHKTTISYFFTDENKVIKEIEIEYLRLFERNLFFKHKGFANYKIDGSVLKFDNAKGALIMFPISGEAIESKDNHIVINITNYVEDGKITGLENLKLYRK